jgi:hypothetical protein
VNNMKAILGIAAVGFIFYTVLGSGGGARAVDLGQVTDRTSFALENYSGFLDQKEVTEISDANMQEFTRYYQDVLNNEPRFYGETLGVAYQDDASFTGYADSNDNGVQDSDEAKVFSVELDSANERLIVSDVSGNSTEYRSSGGGFFTGMLIGSMLSRQGRSGIMPGSFSSRKTVARSAYRAPSSFGSAMRSSARSGARSGGLSAGK